MNILVVLGFIVTVSVCTSGAPIRHLPQDELSQDERNLVWHCFRFHQVTLQKEAFQPCAGIGFNQSTLSSRNVSQTSDNDRLAKMLQYRDQVSQAVAVQIMLTGKSNHTKSLEHSQVMYCALNQIWRGNQDHICYNLVEAVYRDDMAKEYPATRYSKIAELTQMYEQEKSRALVEDCYRNHRHDRFSGCFNVSWDNDNSQDFVPTISVYREIWNGLVKGLNCPKWFDLEPKLNAIDRATCE